MNAKLADIHFVYGQANGNGRIAFQLYRKRYPTRWQPNHQTFARVHQNRAEHGSFTATIEDTFVNSEMDLAALISNVSATIAFYTTFFIVAILLYVSISFGLRFPLCFPTSVTESKKVCSNRKGSADENGDVRSKRPCSESSKNLSNSLRVEKKFGVIDPIVCQVTPPSTLALDPWSDETVRKDQLADPEIKPIIEFKESFDEKPSWQDIAPFHPTTKRYWALWGSLHLRNGVLYRKWESDDGKTFRGQLILPKTRVSTVLKELHGSLTGGHFGVMKTLYKKFVSASTGTMCEATWKSVVAYVIPVPHSKVPENALEEDCSSIMWERLSNE
ncbi:integrase_H2C2 domain-containing protein [Trichonephila clavipes]|nr:integrase_H2C2 domain-containing protein [Trichonephila clavipes]